MADKATGLVLLGLGVIVYVFKYLAEATFKSGPLPENAVAYKDLESPRTKLVFLSAILVALGILSLVRAARGKQSAGEGR